MASDDFLSLNLSSYRPPPSFPSSSSQVADLNRQSFLQHQSFSLPRWSPNLENPTRPRLLVPKEEPPDYGVTTGGNFEDALEDEINLLGEVGENWTGGDENGGFSVGGVENRNCGLVDLSLMGGVSNGVSGGNLSGRAGNGGVWSDSIQALTKSRVSEGNDGFLGAGSREGLIIPKKEPQDGPFAVNSSSSTLPEHCNLFSPSFGSLTKENFQRYGSMGNVGNNVAEEVEEEVISISDFDGEYDEMLIESCEIGELNVETPNTDMSQITQPSGAANLKRKEEYVDFRRYEGLGFKLPKQEPVDLSISNPPTSILPIASSLQLEPIQNLHLGSASVDQNAGMPNGKEVSNEDFVNNSPRARECRLNASSDDWITGFSGSRNGELRNVEVSANSMQLVPRNGMSNVATSSSSNMHNPERALVVAKAEPQNLELAVTDATRALFAQRMSRYSDMVVLQPDLQTVIVPEAGALTCQRERVPGLIRVPPMSPEEQLQSRDHVRRLKICYECTRRFLVRQLSKAEGGSGLRSRPDMKAYAIVDSGTNCLYTRKNRQRYVGQVPGIEVGDVFFFRMEMMLVGLHCQIQAGIDYVPASRRPTGEPIATSVVASGGYEDDEDSGNVLIYTGHGGRGRNITKQLNPQKLERGNLALWVSMRDFSEVRVIRGFSCSESPSGRIYIYDGLYQIQGMWPDVGKSGHGVFKYKLERIPNQPEMGSTIYRRAESLKSSLNRRTGYVHLDISDNNERIRIPLYNDVDADQSPLLYKYTAQPFYPPFGMTFGTCGGCDCIGSCSIGCPCITRNGGEFPYDGEGMLIKGKELIFECGSSCKCSKGCRNRVSQNGLKTRLEVFRTSEAGWAVRSSDLIKAGSFVCELAGVVLTRQQAVLVAMGGENVIYASQFPNRWTEWGDLSHMSADSIQANQTDSMALLCDFGIDVSTYRNAGCYVAHSSIPNLFIQLVLYDHQNVAYPHLMMFATENILPMRELTIDYGLGHVWPRIGT